MVTMVNQTDAYTHITLVHDFFLKMFIIEAHVY